MERLTREWRADCWRRLNLQMRAAMKRMADVDMENKDSNLEYLGEKWELSISRLFEGVEKPDTISLSTLRRLIENGDDDDEEMLLRMEKEIEDTKFRLKRGYNLGRFDQFWDDNLLFECRYSRLKWFNFSQMLPNAPLDVYSQALKGNKNITHITFFRMNSDFDVNRFLCDLPWVTSITPDRRYATTPTVRRNLLFIESNDLDTFAKEIKLETSSTYIFLDGVSYSGELGNSVRVLISFVPPTSGKSLTLRVKHSGEEDPPLEVTLGSTKVQLNPPSKSSLTIDDITLYPFELSGPSKSDHLSFEPEVRNGLFIRFIGYRGRHCLHDIELLDEAGLEYMPPSVSLSKPSN